MGNLWGSYKFNTDLVFDIKWLLLIFKDMMIVLCDFAKTLFFSDTCLFMDEVIWCLGFASK